MLNLSLGSFGAGSVVIAAILPKNVLASSNGCLKQAISNKLIPNDHITAFIEYTLLRSESVLVTISGYS